jgi:hypothetical protein
MRLVNLVGTRCTDGDRAALRRWYADHVHQLFAFDGLLEARLLARDGVGTGDAPEVLCLYHFADAQAFADYEQGPVRAAAAADRAMGSGRDGIEITLRRAWTRLYRRSAAGGAAAPVGVALLGAGDDPTLRPLAAAHDGAIELYRSTDGEPAVLLMAAPAAPPLPQAAWQADYLSLWHWTR